MYIYFFFAKPLRTCFGYQDWCSFHDSWSRSYHECHLNSEYHSDIHTIVNSDIHTILQQARFHLSHMTEEQKLVVNSEQGQRRSSICGVGRRNRYYRIRISSCVKLLTLETRRDERETRYRYRHHFLYRVNTIDTTDSDSDRLDYHNGASFFE